VAGGQGDARGAAPLSVEVVYETHSTTEDNEAGIATGWLPGRLSETGRRQAAELGARRRDDGLSVVFVPDLRRAVETAEIAFAGSSLPVVEDARLRECNYGDLNGTTEAARHRAAHIDVPYSGGESWREAVDRAAGFFDELRGDRDGERVLVIGNIATRLALEVFSGGRNLEDAIAVPFVWQPGWEYRL
jgi:2,3-bisphosphoglycerate-dependent phosphoglycerate mutase